MDVNSITTIVSVGGSIVVQILGLMSINRLLSYRVSELEKVVENHGKILDRIDAIETKVHYNEKEIDRLSRKVG